MRSGPYRGVVGVGEVVFRVVAMVMGVLAEASWVARACLRAAVIVAVARESGWVVVWLAAWCFSRWRGAL